eukprot:66549-Pyramimonas_sp.AAC.1
MPLLRYSTVPQWYTTFLTALPLNHYNSGVLLLCSTTSIAGHFCYNIAVRLLQKGLDNDLD